MRKGIIALILFIFLAWPGISAATWVRYYDGPGHDTDVANAIAVDQEGNVVVTGTSEDSDGLDDFQTIKYAADGTRLWAKRNHSGVEAGGVAIDGAGNVYVTGTTISSGLDEDIFTAKYNAGGRLQWERSYDGARDDRDDVPTCIAVDDNGNVYVAGRSWRLSTDWDAVVIKYDSNGKRQWAQRYNGRADDSDSIQAIALDSSANVYVTGYTLGLTSSFDYLTIKYDTDGKRQWVRRYNGPKNNFDQAGGIATDAAGNVYVTGASTATVGTGDDYVTVKYNRNGVRQWVKRYNGPGNSSDMPHAIAVDPDGGVYVTGESFGTGTGRDFATVKYDTSGKRAWVRRYDGPGGQWDGGLAMALDSASNVYVAGYSTGSGSGYDFTTIKYSNLGKRLWVKRRNGSGNGLDQANDIALDANGNVYITGQSQGASGGTNYLTIGYPAE